MAWGVEDGFGRVAERREGLRNCEGEAWRSGLRNLCREGNEGKEGKDRSKVIEHDGRTAPRMDQVILRVALKLVIFWFFATSRNFSPTGMPR